MRTVGSGAIGAGPPRGMILRAANEFDNTGLLRITHSSNETGSHVHAAADASLGSTCGTRLTGMETAGEIPSRAGPYGILAG